jgi:hypothetical protein
MDRLETLQFRREQADEYSAPRNLDQWGVRVAWFVLSEGVAVGGKLCSKYNKQSNAWKCYQNLVNNGIIVEGPEGGIRYTPHPDWEDGDGPLRWFEAIAVVAAGGKKHPLL